MKWVIATFAAVLFTPEMALADPISAMTLISGAGSLAGTSVGASIFGAAAGTVATVGQIAGLAGGALSTLQAGSAESAAFKQQAAQARLERKQEETQAAFEAEERTRALRKQLATQNAIFGAAGVSGLSGSAQAIQQADIEFMGREQERAAVTSATNQEILRAQQEGFRRSGKAARSASRFKAGSSLISGLDTVFPQKKSDTKA